MRFPLWKYFSNPLFSLLISSLSHFPKWEREEREREPGFKEESLVSVKKNISSMYVPRLNGIKVPVLFPKNIEKKQLCRHDKVYYYFWKSNIPVINLLVDSRNMIKVSKNVGL